MGPIMLDVAGYELSLEEIDKLDHPLIGGLILFSRNYHDQTQLADLVKHIRSVTRNDIIIATDHEGGRVQRFRQGFSKIPAMGDIATKSSDLNIDPEHVSQQLGWLMAAELLAFDIDISFAPVLDIHGVSEVIGDRSFHQQPAEIIRFASQFIKGMHQAGMKATGKHFTGHGNVLEDSHIAMPVDSRTRQEIFKLDMAIFSAIHQQGLLDAVMPAHVIYPDVDDLPAGFSKIWIQQILRQQLEFEGVVFSDDLSMQGAVQMGDIVQRAELAIAAGCDMVLVCNDASGAGKVIDGLPTNLPPAVRAKRLRKNNNLDFMSLQKASEYLKAQRVLEKFHAG
ncbi:beta-N-acetylhexosaminidase [Paraglaciecola aquimarina]|uniref:Beta-hexosaminidase n=1 Tax=Paraglaciecola aquimarina TaxID=1235557 RepID=A0ABU3SZA1_9ALTE|nr:beta-N-acetylhexosaminidase [Paraglaciecola aquimarina]MDU0355349.1 beta-N-acetylhexosaminidase [Paraglaciecola aquimarina]